MCTREFLPKNVSKPIAAGRASGNISLADRGLYELPRAVLDPGVHLDDCTTAWCEPSLAAVQLWQHTRILALKMNTCVKRCDRSSKLDISFVLTTMLDVQLSSNPTPLELQV